MMSMAQPFSPHPAAMQQHPGLPPGHPMAQGHPANPGQPGQGLSQQMHPGVSGAGVPHISPGAGPVMTGIPPGAGGPSPGGPGGAGPSAHALSHLNPGQAQQLFQQQQHQQQQQMFQASKLLSRVDLFDVRIPALRVSTSFVSDFVLAAKSSVAIWHNQLRSSCAVHGIAFIVGVVLVGISCVSGYGHSFLR